MRAFIVPVPDAISPLGAPARDARLLDRSVGEAMEDLLWRAGLTITPASSLDEAEARARREPEGALVLLDSVACSRVVLRRFLAAARAHRAAALVCALPRAVGTDVLSHLGGLDPGAPDADPAAGARPTVWTAPLYFVRRDGAIARAHPVLLRHREKVVACPLPPGILGRREEPIAIGASWLCNIGHWVHVLRANAAAIQAWWFDHAARGLHAGGLAWFALRALAGFPWTSGRLAAAVNAIDRRARVHHRAHLELSVVRARATIEPLASVRSAFIGEGAYIGDGAQVFGSVIGPGAFVARNAVVIGSVVYPGALAGQQLMQLSVLGEGACAFTNSAFFDVNFSRNVRVAHRGRLADSGSQFLGACVGPGARVSAGVWVASGREIPAGALLVKPPDEIAQRLEVLPPGAPAIVRGGVARAIEAVGN